LLDLLTAGYGPFRPIPPYAICVRFRGTADTRRPEAAAGCDANDPSLPFDDQFFCDAQQRFSLNGVVMCGPQLEDGCP
jgi:hypothetical protein